MREAGSAVRPRYGPEFECVCPGARKPDRDDYAAEACRRPEICLYSLCYQRIRRCISGMPTYEYECRSCGHEFETFQSMSDDALTDCPECRRSDLRRLIGGGSGIIFKGSGFYVNDSRSSGASKSSGAKESGDAKSSASSSEKSSAGSAAKPSSAQGEKAGA